MGRKYLFGMILGFTDALLVRHESLVLGSESLRVSYFISDEAWWKQELLAQFVPFNIVDDILKIFISSNMLSDRIFRGYVFIWGVFG